NGGCVANFTLATTDRGYTAANGTQIPDRTEWHNIVLWSGLAKVADQYVKKGSKVYIDGKIRTRSYDDQNGIKRYVTEVWGDNLELLDKKPDNSGGFPPPPPAPIPAQPKSAAAKPKPEPENNAASYAEPDASSEEAGDDLPF
ncbi:MAG: single-stranded DNA-binding protein, partial [Dysgonamonadaceae bacterium]|nr:single-stranded DNA-binding protein [Dysgonamonadaceae bacterium]